MKNCLRKFKVAYLLVLPILFFIVSTFNNLKTILFFKNISSQYKLKSINQDSLLIDSSLNITYKFLNDSSFTSSEYNNLINEYRNKGCGGSTIFFMNLLRLNGINAKIVQLTVNNIAGGHVICEVETNHGVSLVDPLYNFVFKDSNGNLTGAMSVIDNMTLINRPKYYLNNTINGFSYTNWNKFGYFSKFIFRCLCLLNKQFADNFSFRAFWLYYKIYFDLFMLFLTSYIVLYTIKKVK
jgi:hypothetical protein